MLARAGRSCIMSKSDMVAAYKTIPVCLRQRPLQYFKFMGALFLDLRLIFGDKAACMFFDRMHFCIIQYMVLPRAYLPAAAVGRAIDDVPTVVPASAGEASSAFVREYRHQLGKLNIGAAPVDPLCIKAFDGSMRGEVLGVEFRTDTMTWSLSAQKTSKLVILLKSATRAQAVLNLHQAEQLLGLLTNFAQLARPVYIFADELINFLRLLLAGMDTVSVHKREEIIEEVPPGLQSDCRLLISIIQDAHKSGLPILIPTPPVPITVIPIFTDVSGELTNNASLGILVPQYGAQAPLVAALRLPFHFLLTQDENEHSTVHKTTCLESLSYLATLCIDPARFVHQEVNFNVDNLASTLALPRGRSRKDTWATTLVRAARVVAAALGTTLHTTWIPRCSSREAIIADDLSHCKTASLSKSELAAFLDRGQISFPDPILQWMQNPRTDHLLGVSCLKWIKREHPDCGALFSNLPSV